MARALDPATDRPTQVQRLRHRRGPKKAICAVAASILTAAYHTLREGTFYHDLGPDHFHRASPEAQARRLVSQIVKLGFVRTITEADPEAVVSVWPDFQLFALISNAAHGLVVANSLKELV